MKKEFTVGVLTYDESTKFISTLTSLIMMDGVKELIILENGVLSHLPKEFNTLMAIARFREIDIQYVTGGVSMAEGRKKLYDRATGKYILFADGDSVYPADFLVEYEELFEDGFDAVFGTLESTTTFDKGEVSYKIFTTPVFKEKICPPSGEADLGAIKYAGYGGTIALRTGCPHAMDWTEFVEALGEDKITLIHQLSLGKKVAFSREGVAYHLRDASRAYAGGENLVDSTVKKHYSEELYKAFKEAQ